ncbi:MAG: antitoxin [Gammaproteobacteria bacterium]|nr:antitoxin [Gammaproteobacteria bacterium]MYF27774.1 antitoxin [Gammaproteobacteria bacterium]MYK45732.1 antitoxin [Gammaproteobacteria bacterium]
MQTKLTLRMDDRLIAGAKQHAARAGKSLSQVVAEYFLVCMSGSQGSVDETPRVSRLRGCLKDKGVAEADYLKYLEDKHS